MIPDDIATGVSATEAAKLQELATGGRVLELGAQYGFSTIVLAQTAAMVHSVDWHGGDELAGYGNSLEPYFANLRRCGVTNVIAHVGRFEQVLPLIAYAQFDGCFLDGAHDTDSVRRDTLLALPLVRSGGWFAWHDYGRFGVAAAVDPVVAGRGMKLERVEHLAWIRK